jgi:hypothetical protein
MSFSQFELSFEISPIILTGGIASQLPGGMVPIISLLQPQSFGSGLLSASSPLSAADAVAHFSPMPGSTLVKNESGDYPFANQSVAANAIIFQALRVSLMMVAPAPTGGGYNLKLAAFTSLKQQLDQHHLAGGTYTVATPAYLWTNLLLMDLIDVSAGDTGQVQTRWQWNFKQPLLTLAAAQAAQNSLMMKITASMPTTGDPPSASGTGSSVGEPSSGVTPPVIPAAQSLSGTSVYGI